MKGDFRAHEQIRTGLSNQGCSLMRTGKTRSINHLPSILPKLNLFNYPKFVKDVTGELKPSTLQIEQVELLEKVIGVTKFDKSSLVDFSKSPCVVEIGEDFTRSILIDVVGDTYRIVGIGKSPTTFCAPNNDVGIGLKFAVEQLLTMTGVYRHPGKNSIGDRKIPNVETINEPLLVINTGTILRVLIITASTNVSTLLYRRIIRRIPSCFVGELCFEDSGFPVQALNKIVRTSPDLVCVIGISIQNQFKIKRRINQIIQFAESSLPGIKRPEVVFLSQDQTNKKTAQSANLISRNRPLLEDKKYNNLGGQGNISEDFSNLWLRIQKKEVPGLNHVSFSNRRGVISGEDAFGRIIKYLDLSNGIQNGVLGINIGLSKTTVASSRAGNLRVEIFPEYGVASGIEFILNNNLMEDILETPGVNTSRSYLEEYLLHKSINPALTPVTHLEEDIEYAIAQQVLKLALMDFTGSKSWDLRRKPKHSIDTFSNILISGSIFSLSQDLLKTADRLLDGIQPVGASALYLDSNQIINALGAAASINPFSVVQVLESGIFTHLFSVISVDSKSREGETILRIKIIEKNQEESHFEIRKGDLLKLPLTKGQRAEIFLQPFHGCDVGMGSPGRGGAIYVTGGLFGVIVDGRGRPLRYKQAKYGADPLNTIYQLMESKQG